MLVNLNSLTQSAIWCFAWRVALAHPGLLPTESNFFSTPVRHNSAQEYFPEEVLVCIHHIFFSTDNTLWKASLSIFNHTIQELVPIHQFLLVMGPPIQ
ncbi:hypothetical protein PCANC_12283 [Puccinia coronata f. sp. avenae]|uniref:Uncharacterized protein n=1 Tax=Puccinia coronata f. sp. avenae TaxID=200324 RepID=A0A2N5SZ25_9BASI|nr:hypothetical protein PCANC_12283 [Puccinia coronata f. sp. avenae]